MAHILVDLNDAVVHLSRLESIAAWRQEVRIPISCLRMVHVEEMPMPGLSLVRLPGLAWPRTFVIGSCRWRGKREFVAVRAGRPAVVLEAEGTAWDRVVVSDPEAFAIAAELASLLLGRGQPRAMGSATARGWETARGWAMGSATAWVTAAASWPRDGHAAPPGRAGRRRPHGLRSGPLPYRLGHRLA